MHMQNSRQTSGFLEYTCRYCSHICGCMNNIYMLMMAEFISFSQTISHKIKSIVSHSIDGAIVSGMFNRRKLLIVARSHYAYFVSLSKHSLNDLHEKCLYSSYMRSIIIKQQQHMDFLHRFYENIPYLKIQYIALNPSFRLIFFPSSYVRQ